MRRKLFCEICPATYQISKQKNIFMRNFRDMFKNIRFATRKTEEKLPFLIYEHQSVIRRTLGNVDMTLQENKAINLSLASPKVNGVLIYPGEVFSFWKLVGKTKASKGYKEGLTISRSQPSSGIGGGMCQFSNLIHYLVLHSPLEIVEQHHHDGVDLFPDCGRKVPFGTGTSITYNYLDYRVRNNTDQVFQLIVYVTDTHLCGELRSTKDAELEYEVWAKEERFIKREDGVYRLGDVYHTCRNKNTGEVLWSKCIRKNCAKVMYDTTNLHIVEE